MEPMSTPRHRWIVFGAMTGVYFSFGIAVTAIAPMLTVVRDDLGVSRGAMGFALGAWALIYIVTAPLAGRFIDRIGLGWSLALGGLSVSGSLVLRAAAQGLGSLWLAIAFFGVFGPLVSASAPKLMATWFPDENERRRGVGWYSVAPAIGGTITLAVTNPVLLEWFDSWRQVLVFEATIGAVATTVWVVVWNRVERPTTTRVEPAAAGSADGSFRYLLGSSEIRLILFVAFALFFLSHGTSNWMPTILEEFSGMSPSTAGAWLAVGGLVSIVAGATIPAYATPERMHLLMAGLFGAAVLVMAGLLLAPTSLHGPIAVIGGVRGALVPLAIVTLLAADRVSVTNTGIANGLWFSIAEIGGVSGPLVTGALADTDAGYEAALLTIAAIASLGGLVALRSHRHRIST
jgi:CP family cyanate transporter-like MFS transporter